MHHSTVKIFFSFAHASRDGENFILVRWLIASYAVVLTTAWEASWLMVKINLICRLTVKFTLIYRLTVKFTLIYRLTVKTILISHLMVKISFFIGGENYYHLSVELTVNIL